MLCLVATAVGADDFTGWGFGLKIGIAYNKVAKNRRLQMNLGGE
jgi:hypothetical protein